MTVLRVLVHAKKEKRRVASTARGTGVQVELEAVVNKQPHFIRKQ